MRYIKDHLYEQSYATLNYRGIFEYFKKFKYSSPSACSVLKTNKLIGRNYDWIYDDHVDAVIRTSNANGRYATIGIAHSFGNITNINLKSGLVKYDDIEKLPFFMTDCLNEKGLYCSINVVPLNDKDDTKVVGTMGIEICQIMLPRFLCDYAENVEEAISLLYLNKIYAPLNSNTPSDCHLFLADKTTSCTVEFINGNISIIRNTDILTNFYLTDWNGTIASVPLGNTPEEIRATGLTDHAMGLERYAILSRASANISNEYDMLRAMKTVAYSKSYDINQDPFWYSEFYNGNYTIYSTIEELNPIISAAIAASGKRDGKSWITTHTSVYNLDDLSLRVVAQEDYCNLYSCKLTETDFYGIEGIEYLFD